MATTTDLVRDENKNRNRFSPQTKARAVKRALQLIKDDPTLKQWTAKTTVAKQIGATANSVDDWVTKAGHGRPVTKTGTNGHRAAPKKTTGQIAIADADEVIRLKAENKKLRTVINTLLDV